MRKGKFHPIESVEMLRSKDRTHITERQEFNILRESDTLGTEHK